MIRDKLRTRVMVRSCANCSGTGFKSDSALAEPCTICSGYGVSHKRCAQCWKWKSFECFVGKRSRLLRRCDICTEKYKNWGKKPLHERENATQPRSKIRPDGPLRVKFVVKSGNRKTGPIPVSMTSARTCPSSCSWFGKGCYAEQHMVSIHWRRLSDGQGLDWDSFLSMVKELPEGQLWRHNEAGDLPGDGEEIDRAKLKQLVSANLGKRGFTYTHKPLMGNYNLLLSAIEDGFTINISADNLEEADVIVNLGLPAVVVLPSDAPIKGNRTPKGRNIVVCPAEWSEKVTCEKCGLCAVANRKSVIGFRAHGDRSAHMTTKLKQLPLFQG